MRTSAIGYGLLATATILPLSLVGTSATAAGSNASTAPAEDPSGSRVDLVVKDTAPQAGLAVKSKTWSADGVDTNDDGDQDVWIIYHGQGGKLRRNEGSGTYRRVAKAAWPATNPDGRTIDRHDCAWADVDLNGRLDSYCRPVASSATSSRTPPATTRCGCRSVRAGSATSPGPRCSATCAGGGGTWPS